MSRLVQYAMLDFCTLFFLCLYFCCFTFSLFSVFESFPVSSHNCFLLFQVRVQCSCGWMCTIGLWPSSTSLFSSLVQLFKNQCVLVLAYVFFITSDYLYECWAGNFLPFSDKLNRCFSFNEMCWECQVLWSPSKAYTHHALEARLQILWEEREAGLLLLFADGRRLKFGSCEVRLPRSTQLKNNPESPPKLIQNPITTGVQNNKIGDPKVLRKISQSIN